MHRRSFSFRRPFLVVLPVLAAACGACRHAEAPGAFTPPPTVVETATVARRAVQDRFNAVGTVEAAEIVAIAAETAGRVVDMPFDEGASVARGAIIAQLDASEVRAERNRAAALLDHARVNRDRVEQLARQEIAPRQAVDDIRADLRVAEADVALADARLAKMTLLAPFAGVVGSRRLSPGAWLRAGDVVTDLTQVDEVKVVFATPERFLAQVATSAPVEVVVPAYPQRPLNGHVALVDPVLDPVTRTARTVARVANPELLLRPGMSADVSVVLDERTEALTVPAEAVFFEGEQALAYVVQPDGTVARTPLTLGTRLSDVVEVTAGVTEGATVVKTGHQKLFPGAKVTAAGEPAAAPGSAGS